MGIERRRRTGGVLGLRWSDDPDESWRAYGECDPYFGVLTEDKYRRSNLTEEILKDFFSSGEAHVATTLKILHDHVTSSLQNNNALDFGCGVGRLIIPLASRFAKVTGIDVSEAYRLEALNNCTSRGINNVQFLEALAPLLQVKGRFDLVHSSIVFNHIPWTRGREIIAQMFELLGPGGAMAVQIMLNCQTSALRRSISWLRRNFSPFNWLINLAQGRPAFEPLMQGNAYPLDELLPMLKTAGACNFFIELQKTPEGHVFAMVFCVKVS